MSMSVHITGIRAPDDTWQRMKAAHDACLAAGVPVPMEVGDFFDGHSPDPAGVVIELDHSHAVQPWENEYSAGIEVTISKLPPGLTVLRFFNSW